jgi:uncharacterized repeat protein (TIGR03803 family)
VLHNFDPAKVLDDGAYSNSGVAFGPNGSLFGATTFGGDFACDCGIVYQLTQGANDEWHEKILYVFVGVSRGGNDVSFPESGVVFDADGNIFGTTPGGGDFSCNFGCGGVYELIANGDGTYTEKVLHIFSGGTSDGMGGEAEPLLDDKGNLFGTTANGGGTGCQNGGFGCGTVFQMRKSSGEFKERVILHLNGKNGYAPFGNLTLVGNDLFGTTEGGGQTNQGIVFRLTNVSGKWQETVLHHFGQGQDGSDPEAGLISDGNGGFYGTTRGGGTGGQGTVYHITP